MVQHVHTAVKPRGEDLRRDRRISMSEGLGKYQSGLERRRRAKEKLKTKTKKKKKVLFLISFVCERGGVFGRKGHRNRAKSGEGEGK